MSSYRLTPVALYQQVAELLRQRIFSHELSPGSWLDEQTLANEYGISRTPLREALKVLASEGLVTLKPHRGCYVAEVSEHDLDEIYQVLALLEAEAARLAMTQSTPAALKKLTAIHDELEQAAAAQNINQFFDANQRFHYAIQQLSGNQWLQNMIIDLRKVIKLSRHHSLFSEGRLNQSLKEHRTLLEAFKNKDTEAISQLMHQHIHGGRQALTQITLIKDPAVR